MLSQRGFRWRVRWRRVSESRAGLRRVLRWRRWCLVRAVGPGVMGVGGPSHRQWICPLVGRMRAGRVRQHDRMPPVPENVARQADSPRVNGYDVLAEAYTAENESSFINAYYARPAIVALAGDVAGRRVLDAGCGSGPVLAALRDRGAIVTGFDSSPGMLEQARQRLGDDADLHEAHPGPAAAVPRRRVQRCHCGPSAALPGGLGAGAGGAAARAEARRPAYRGCRPSLRHPRNPARGRAQAPTISPPTTGPRTGSWAARPSR